MDPSDTITRLTGLVNWTTVHAYWHPHSGPTLLMPDELSAPDEPLHWGVQAVRALGWTRAGARGRDFDAMCAGARSLANTVGAPDGMFDGPHERFDGMFRASIARAVAAEIDALQTHQWDDVWAPGCQPISVKYERLSVAASTGAAEIVGTWARNLGQSIINAGGLDPRARRAFLAATDRLSDMVGLQQTALGSPPISEIPVPGRLMTSLVRAAIASEGVSGPGAA